MGPGEDKCPGSELSEGSGVDKDKLRKELRTGYSWLGIADFVSWSFLDCAGNVGTSGIESGKNEVISGRVDPDGDRND